MLSHVKVFFLVALFACFTTIIRSQSHDGFDMKKAYQLAKEKKIPPGDVEGYIQYLHYDYLSKQHQNHDSDMVPAYTIYKGYGNSIVAKVASPSAPQGLYCANAGFENLNFSNWVGSTGYVTTAPVGASSPNYIQSGTGTVSPAGMNASLLDTRNYYTIMTLPAIDSSYPNCVGYDSIACKQTGGVTVSEIPVVNPQGGPSSVRLNGALGNQRASKLYYQMALNPNNKSFTVSYAVVLSDGYHGSNEQPYFSVKIRDQNSRPIPGCSVYTITCDSNLLNPASPRYDSSWARSAVRPDIMYRKWATYSFDLSNYPTITTVNIEFYVGGCSYGGHYGYAYIDAECGQGGAVGSFCGGSNVAHLTAPPGYASYQWVGPSGPIAAANGGNAYSATVSPATAGQVFTCNVRTQNGCATSLQATLSVTSVSIRDISSTPACLNGNNGTAKVSVTGSSLGYNFQWLNNSGIVVNTNQQATGLSSGTYTVIVSSPSCGSDTKTVSVGVTPVLYYTLPAPFCGTRAEITNLNGSNYKWYTASPLALIPGATNATLSINNPTNGAQYFLTYTSSNGCKDSIRYGLTQSPGGDISVSDVKRVCPGNNSEADIHLQTLQPPPYSYSVTGTGGYHSVLSNTSLLKNHVVNLPIGSYSVEAFDGKCLYHNTFTVQPFVYDYTVTPTDTTICRSAGTTLAVNFINPVPSSCGLSSSNDCSLLTETAIGSRNGTNGSDWYPCVYGHSWRTARHQLLFPASELKAMGVIPGKLSSLSFMVQSIPSNYTGNIPGLTIKLKCTQQADFWANQGVNVDFDNVGLTQVYSVSNYSPVVGWNKHVFSNTYDWDGSTNLLVDVCYNLTYTNTSNPIMPYTKTSSPLCLFDISDANTLCGISGGFPIPTDLRPNIALGHCGLISDPTLFSYTWTPSSSVSPVNNKITVANPTVTTIYTVQVEPTGQSNCTQVQSATVQVNPKPEVGALTDKQNGCRPLLVALYTTTTTGTANWDYGDGSLMGTGLTTTHLYNTPGTYTAAITYTDAIGCVDTTKLLVPVTVYSVPVASFQPSLFEATTIDGQIDFTNRSTVLSTNAYVWDIGGVATSYSRDMNYAFTEPGSYTIVLKATNAEGCVDDTSAVIKINSDIVFYAPNAFTPDNGDALNDGFKVVLTSVSVDYSTFKLTLFDRWGKIVYETTDVNNSWNGAKHNSGGLLKQGTYIWKVSFSDTKHKYHEKLGHVTLIKN